MPIELTIDDVIPICKKCKHRNKSDNLYYMAWWSYCRQKCKLMKVLEVSKYNDDTIKREIHKLTN